MKAIYKLLIIPGFALAVTTSCGDLDQESKSSVTQSQLDELAMTNPSAIVTVTDAIVQGMYGHTSAYQGNHDIFGITSIGLAADLSTEDMVQYASHFFYFDYDIDNRNATYRRTNSTWEFCYTMVQLANQVIVQIPQTDTPDVLKPNLGQALAGRAFAMHIAIQRFQQTYQGNEELPGVPVILTSQDDAPTVASRGTVQSVYDRILKDYTMALSMLEGYERTVKGAFDTSIVQGLLARVYMTMGNYTEAAKMAKAARAGYTLMTAEEAASSGYNDISNAEWMWGFDVTSENTTAFASLQSHMATYSAGYAGIGIYKIIDKRLSEQMSATDVRRGLYNIDGQSADFPFGTNFKIGSAPNWLNDLCYMRASEMVLIEAEALAHQNKGAEAATVLMELMVNRDPAYSKSTVTVEDVFLQKRLELWGEGQIFFDYLRLKKGVNRAYEGNNHTIPKVLEAGAKNFYCQIPDAEIASNPELANDQNP